MSILLTMKMSSRSGILKIMRLEAAAKEARYVSRLLARKWAVLHPILTAARLKRHETPGIYTSIAPAWNDDNLFQISEKVRSSCIFAHVRAASLGSPVTQVNTHPFAAHRYIFMHNGYLASFEKMRKTIIALIDDEVYRFIQGTSDSEHCFGLFLTELLKDGPLQGKATPVQMQSAMNRTLRLLEAICAKHAVAEGSMLNFCVSDGDTVIATKHVIGAGPAASLYFSCGSGWEAVKGVRGQYRMARHDRREEVVIVASEKLTDEAEDWINIPRNHMVVITPSLNVLVVPTDEASAQEAMAGSAMALPIPNCMPDCASPCTPIAAIPTQEEIVLSDELMREHNIGSPTKSAVGVAGCGIPAAGACSSGAHPASSTWLWEASPVLQSVSISP